MDTAALNILIGRGGLVMLPPLVFKVDTPIFIPSDTVIDGGGAVIESCHQLHTFAIDGKCNVTIRNLKIQGDSIFNSDSAAIGAAIGIQKSRDILIENVQISNMQGRGIVASSNVKDLKIQGCHISDCSISVFLFKGVNRGRVESCNIFDSRIMGIFVDDGTEGDTAETAIPNHDTIITGNMILGGGTSSRNNGAGIAVSGSTDTIIANNIVRGFGNPSRDGHGIILNNGQGGFNQGKRTVVNGNILSNNNGYGLYSIEQEDLVESGNVYKDNGLSDRMFTKSGSAA